MNGLEALEKMYNRGRMDLHYVKCNECFNIVASELREGEKYKKALEILKEKTVDLGSLLYYVRSSNHPLAFYNMGMANENKKLTKDEFDLLKEVLGQATHLPVDTQAQTDIQ